MLIFSLQCHAQTLLESTLNNYTEAKKRLLAKNIGRFLYVSYQGQWDLDSCVRYACKIYGLNQVFPYDEMIASPGISSEIELLDGDRVTEVIQSATSFSPDKKVRILLELAIYYLHKPGSKVQHLDSAHVFIEQARAIGRPLNRKKWDLECDALMGEYHFQKRNQVESEKYFSSIARRLEKDTDTKRLAIAYHQLSLHLSPLDTSRLAYLEKASAIFQQMRLNEHAIEVLSDIVTFYFLFNWEKAEIKLNELLVLQKQSGYRHIMDTYFVLSYLRSVKSDYMGSFLYNDSCVAVMTQTGDSTIFSMVCTRLADLYNSLGEWEKSFTWHLKGLERRDREPKLFWYANLTNITQTAGQLNLMPEYLSSIKKISSEYPPEGKADSVRVNMVLSLIYDLTGNESEAEKHFQRYIKEIENLPAEHQQVFTVTGFHQAARHYFKKKQFALARTWLNKIWPFVKGRQPMHTLAYAYKLAYQLDSAEGKYREAFLNHQQYKIYWDTLQNISQRFKNQELDVRYETAKKDQDIQILRQQGVIQQSALKQAKQTRNLIFGGAIFLFIIAGLLYNQYRVKQKNARLIEQKNSKLEQLVDEKQWLLKEVHHRVKNNLQTIVSLLELQSEYLSNDALAAVQASQNRIHATSLLHQKLYQDDKVSTVNMSSYLSELIYHLKEAYNVKNSIHFKINIDHIDLDVSQAIPLGLIVNEAITNSIRHAFTNNTEKAEIKVSFTNLNGLAELIIADNGSGFAMEASKDASGLGLKLVRGLASDIDGRADIKSINGTYIRVRFNPRSTLASLNPINELSNYAYEKDTDRRG